MAASAYNYTYHAYGAASLATSSLDSNCGGSHDSTVSKAWARELEVFIGRMKAWDDAPRLEAAEATGVLWGGGAAGGSGYEVTRDSIEAVLQSCWEQRQVARFVQARFPSGTARTACSAATCQGGWLRPAVRTRAAADLLLTALPRALGIFC